MAHITSIGAAKFTTLDYVPNTANDANSVAGSLHALFVANSATILATETPTDETVEAAVVHVGDVREFPSLGTPANIVNVPQYGQAVSSQIAGQSDAPSMDFTFNYVPSEHAFIADMREDGEKRMFRVRLANAKQAEDPTTGVDLPYIDEDGDLREFSDFYFVGSVASFEIVPNLTDSNQLNVTLTIDGEMQGPFSYDADGAAYA